MKNYLAALVITLIIHALVAYATLSKIKSVMDCNEQPLNINNVSLRYLEVHGSPISKEEQMIFEYIIYNDLEIQGTTFSEFKTKYNQDNQ